MCTPRYRPLFIFQGVINMKPNADPVHARCFSRRNWKQFISCIIFLSCVLMACGACANNVTTAPDAAADNASALTEKPNLHTDALIDDLSIFTQQSAEAFLSTEPDNNLFYSPINIYLALGSLSEITAGSSRQEILDALHAGSIDEMRLGASALGENYSVGSCTMASSIWLNHKYDYLQSALDQLADSYGTTSFIGEMGSSEFNKLFEEWVAAQTKGRFAGKELGEDTILALVSAVSYEAKWTVAFDPSKTADGEFRTGNGTTVNCSFMNMRYSNQYYSGEDFAAIDMTLGDGSRMWFVLPNEDARISDLIEDPSFVNLCMYPDKWEDSKFMSVNASIPKFNLAANANIEGAFHKLGISSVFNEAAADFLSILSSGVHIRLSECIHSVRIGIDEYGCSASAFTSISAASGLPPKEEVDFIENRPFIVMVTSPDNIPLFLGVVNNPDF